MTDYGFGGQSWLLGRSAENSIESNLRWGLHSCGVERIDPDHIGEMRSGSDCNMSALLKIAVLSQTQNPPVRQNRQLLLMEVAMLKMPKPTIVFAILGASFAALVTSSAPSFAALSCAESLQLTGTELRVAPMGQPKSEAMGLYSAAVDAHRNRQEGQCEACSRHQPRRLVIATVTATATVTTAIRLALAEGVQAVNRTRPATRVAGRGFFWARHRCVCHAPLKGRTVLGTRSGKEQSVHLRNEANDPKACRFQDLPGAGIFEMGKCPDFPKL